MNEVRLPQALEIRSSVIHGTGVFANKAIPTGRRMIEYVGRRISKKESDRLCEGNNPYIFFIDDEWDLDGSVDWNPARFINHSCAPNCEVEQDDDNRIWIQTIKRIKVGEELSYNYGYDIEAYEDYPCLCGAKRCVGYMVAEEHKAQVTRSRARAH
jgi:SET domain-containing protein